MSELQLYDTTQNIRAVTMSKLLRQFGSLSYTLPPNKSGQSTIKFPQAYTNLPFIQIMLTVDNGSELDQKFILGKVTTTNFIIHVCNSDLTNESKCTINWLSQQL